MYRFVLNAFLLISIKHFGVKLGFLKHLSLLYCREYNKLPQRITFVTSGNFCNVSLKMGICVFGQFFNYKRL